MSRPGEEWFVRIASSRVEEITLDRLKEWFTDGQGSRRRMIDPNARYEVSPRKNVDLAPKPTPRADDPGDELYNALYAPNWGSIKETTPGRVIANAVIFARPRLRANIPFINDPWDSKRLKAIQQQIIDAAVDGRLTYEDVQWTVDAIQWLGYAPTSFLCPSTHIDMLRPSKKVRRLKSQLKRSYADEIAEGDLDTAIKIEGELLDAVSKEQEKSPTPSFDLFRSGARGSLPNNGKNTFLMRGAVETFAEPGKMNISMASLEEGIPKDEFHIYSDLLVQASFGRSMMTSEGGYLSKQLIAAFQTLKLNPDPESDCGSKDTLKVKMTDPKDFRYRFARMSNGKLVEITKENEDDLKGKEIRLRTPLYCKDFQTLCSRCVGTLYYRLKIENIGMLSWKVGNVLLNAHMKAFHDMSIKRTEIDLDEYISEVPLSSIR